MSIEIHPVNTIDHTIKILRESRQTTYNEINSGRLETYKVGTRRYCSERAIRKYISDREAESAKLRAAEEEDAEAETAASRKAAEEEDEVAEEEAAA